MNRNVPRRQDQAARVPRTRGDEPYLRYKRIEECFLQIDDPDRDWENRSQVLTFSGTMFYHYYGEVVSGNSSDYR